MIKLTGKNKLKITFLDLNFCILLMLLPFSSFSQKAKFKGQLINPFNENSENIPVYALPYNVKGYYSWFADSSGVFFNDSIEYGIYKIEIDGFPLEKTIDSFKIDKKEVELKINYPDCKNPNVDGICPKCNKKDKVIKFNLGQIHDVFFATPKDSLKFHRKRNAARNALGYEISDGELIWIKDEKERKKMNDPCKKWFCKRNKIIF
jgi:hypothetical protein